LLSVTGSYSCFLCWFHFRFVASIPASTAAGQICCSASSSGHAAGVRPKLYFFGRLLLAILGFVPTATKSPVDLVGPRFNSGTPSPFFCSISLFRGRLRGLGFVFVSTCTPLGFVPPSEPTQPLVFVCFVSHVDFILRGFSFNLGSLCGSDFHRQCCSVDLLALALFWRQHQHR
jgi:hypothetical protein